jgi:DNA-binding NarL/FixJ family response regulator
MNSPIRVLLVDDHAMVRAGIRRFLAKASNIVVVAEADSAAAAKTMLDQNDIDVALIDIKMPDVNGIELTRWLRARDSALPILIVTAYDDEPYLLAALRAGANGYVLKSAAPRDLIRAVEQVAQGESVVDPALLPTLMQIMSSPPTPEPPNLTEREIEVLKLAANGYTNRDIGAALVISDRTVQSHLARIYRKLNVNTRTEAVKIGMATGIISGGAG